MLKKAAAMFIILTMLVTTVNAAEIFGTNVSALPEGWTLTQTPAEKTTVTMDEDGNILMQYDTTDAQAKPNARIITDYYSADGTQLCISATLEMDFLGSSEAILTLMDTSAQNKVELFVITGSEEGSYSAEFFGGVTTAVLENKAELKFVIDTQNSKGTVFTGDSETPVFSGDYENLPNLDLENLRFLIQLKGNSKIKETGSLKISNFETYAFDGEYKLTSTPENGFNFVDAAVTDRATLNFGIPVTESAYGEENFVLFEEGVKMVFSVEKNGYGVDIIPQNGFSVNKTYKLGIVKITDVYGNVKEENSEIVFKTAPSGYAMPKLTISAEKTEISAKDVTVINFEVTEGEYERSEIYVNDECVSEFAGDKFSYTFSADEAGTYRIYGKTFDEFGGIGISDEVEISVSENLSPTLTVSGISNGEAYTVETVPVASITAQDDDGIKCITVYVDGFPEKSVKAQSLSFDLSQLSAGTHEILVRAEDNYGICSDKAFTVSIESSLYIEHSFSDFSDYKGGTPPANHQGGPQRGYLDAFEIDKEHGISAIIGIDTVNEEYTVGNGAYIGFPMNGTARKFSIEMELNVSASPKQEDPFTFIVRGSGGAMSIAYIQPSQIWCQTGGSNKFTVGEWFKIKFVFDSDKKTFEYYVGDEKLGGEKELPSNIGSLDWLRLFSPNYDDVKTFVAVDNVKVTTICEAPEIKMTKEIFNCGADSVSFTVDGDLDFTSLTADKITVSSEYGNIPVHSISKEGDVINVKLSQKLEGNTEYKITISKDAKFSTGTVIGASTSAMFKTAPEQVAVVNGGFVTGAGSLNFEFEAKNVTQEDVYIYVLTQKYKESRAVESVIKRLTVPKETALKKFNLKYQYPKSNEEIKVYILKGLDTAEVLNSEEYSY